jgi:TPP-dependent trihydroxycyclohexane-1,2-dione (THcHDO) dehydratase
VAPSHALARLAPSGGVWWDVAPAEVSEDPETQRLRRAYEETRQAQQHIYVRKPSERVIA